MVRKKNIFCPACRAENIESNDHDYEDAMIFSPKNCELILAGKKTQTRRLVLLHDTAHAAKRDWTTTISVYRSGRLKWKVVRTYAIQPGRGEKAIGHICITKIRCERVSDITDDDAIAEGVQDYDVHDEHAPSFVYRFKGHEVYHDTPRETFLAGWKLLYSKSDLTELVWVLDFELVKLEKPSLG